VAQVEHESCLISYATRWPFAVQQTAAPIRAVGTEECRYISYFELRGWLSPLVTLFMGFFLWRGFRRMTNAVKTRAEILTY